MRKYHLLNKAKIIEQATFTYSALGKASEKQTKTYKYQGEKQIKPTEDNKKHLNHTNSYSYENELSLLKEREIFKKVYNESIGKIEEISKKNNHDDLKFTAESRGQETDFNEIRYPVAILNDIKTNKITIEEAQNFFKKS